MAAARLRAFLQPRNTQNKRKNLGGEFSFPTISFAYFAYFAVVNNAYGNVGALHRRRHHATRQNLVNGFAGIFQPVPIASGLSSIE